MTEIVLCSAKRQARYPCILIKTIPCDVGTVKVFPSDVRNRVADP